MICLDDISEASNQSNRHLRVPTVCRIRAKRRPENPPPVGPAASARARRLRIAVRVRLPRARRSGGLSHLPDTGRYPDGTRHKGPRVRAWLKGGNAHLSPMPGAPSPACVSPRGPSGTLAPCALVAHNTPSGADTKFNY